MKEYYSIGEVSKIKDITIKALRYYHKVGILIPKYIDEETGYRYYSIDQFVHIDIIKGFLSFNPIINTDGSWLNARFGTGISFPLLIFVNFIAILLFFELYRYYLSKGNNSFYGDMCFLFIFSGSLCSLIDKIFYGGSLDFIGISNLFIADIKDIYINLGILFFIISIVISGYLTEDDNTSFKEDLASIKRFLIFSKNDIVSLFKK